MKYNNNTRNLTSNYFTIPIVTKSSNESQGNILVTGFLLDSASGSLNANITTVEEHLNTDEFADFLSVEDVKLIIVLCHIPTDNDEIQNIYEFLAANKPNTPIVFLTGHSHLIRNKTLQEHYAVAMESGKYGYTLGSMNVTLYDNATADFSITPITCTIDDFLNFLGTTDRSILEAETGQAINNASSDKYDELGLGEQIACAPYNYNSNSESTTLTQRSNTSPKSAHPCGHTCHSNAADYQAGDEEDADDDDWSRNLYDLILDEAFPLHGPFRKRTERKSGLLNFFLLGNRVLRCLFFVLP